MMCPRRLTSPSCGDSLSTLRGLLEELDQVHGESTATVSDPMTWKGSDGVPFIDFQVDFTTDETCFQATSGHVRRSYAEFVWLASELSEDPVNPLPDELPDPGATPEEMGAFVTELCRSDPHKVCGQRGRWDRSDFGCLTDPARGTWLVLRRERELAHGGFHFFTCGLLCRSTLRCNDFSFLTIPSPMMAGQIPSQGRSTR